MAFDITKNLAAPAFPKVELPEVRSPVRVERPERAGDQIRSFQDELLSEPAKTAEVAKKPLAQSAEAARQIAGTAPRPDQVKLPDSLKSPVKESAAAESGLLQQFGAEHQEDILNSPAAALLAGPMQSISPQDLPALTSGSQFLNDALFSADPAAVLEQDGDMETVLDSLGMPGDLIAGLKAEYGEDLPQVSAADVFGAAGIDPAQVHARLNALRNQFVPQIDPAMAVTDQVPAGAEALVQDPAHQNPAAVPGLPGALSGREIRPAGLAGNEVIDGLKRNTTDALSVDFGGPVPGAVSAPGAAAPAGFLKDAAPETVASEGLPAVGGREQADRFSEFKNWRDAAKDMPSELTPESPAMQPAALQGVSAVPMGRKATFDAFNELGDRLSRLSPDQVTKVDMSQDVQTPVSPEAPKSAPKFMDAVISRFGLPAQNMAGSQNAVKAAAGLQPEPVTTTVVTDSMGQPVVADGRGNEPAVLINGKPEHLVKGLQAGMQQGAALTDTQGIKSIVEAVPRKFTVEELMADVTAGRMNLDFVQSDAESFTQSEGGDLSRFAGERLAGQATGGLEKPQAFGTDFAAMLSETQQSAHVGMSTAERAEMAQKVLDNATFLMRQGSGSVRLDLSNANIGPLEVAINLADNKVDIKVFTVSDPVREAMIADLGRLKEALQTQNVNLNHVEVGVGQRFGSSAHSDQNRQFAQQQELREAFAGNGAFSRRPENSDNRPQVSPVAAARRLNQMTGYVSSDGRLQIRI